MKLKSLVHRGSTYSCDHSMALSCYKSFLTLNTLVHSGASRFESEKPAGLGNPVSEFSSTPFLLPYTTSSSLVSFSRNPDSPERGLQELSLRGGVMYPTWPLSRLCSAMSQDIGIESLPVWEFAIFSPRYGGGSPRS